MSTYRKELIDVPDGPLAVGRWEGDDGSVPVIAIHGISSTHRLWLWTTAAAPDLTLIAPDLRGRGDSVDAPAPYGIARHRDDVLAVMDALAIERAVIVGMSMGGFVATALATKAPERVRSLLLVDGGPPMQLPSAPAGDPEDTEQRMADRLERTVQTFADVGAYKTLFRAGVGALLSPDDPLLDAYLAYDLAPAPDGTGLAVRLVPDAVKVDAADVFVSWPVEETMAALTVPTSFLYAEWSIGADSPPAYPGPTVADWCRRVPHLQARQIPGVDHAGTVMSAQGAREVASELQATVAGLD